MSFFCWYKRLIGGITLINKIIFYPCLIFLYHLLLLVLPLNFFLIGLKVPLLIIVFPWLCYPFLIISPILTLSLAFRATPARREPLDWIFPIAVSLIGYSPLIIFYFLVASLNNIRDYALALSFPVIIGLIAFGGARFPKLTRSENPNASPRI